MDYGGSARYVENLSLNRLLYRDMTKCAMSLYVLTAYMDIAQCICVE